MRAAYVACLGLAAFTAPAQSQTPNPADVAHCQAITDARQQWACFNVLNAKLNRQGAVPQVRKPSAASVPSSQTTGATTLPAHEAIPAEPSKKYTVVDLIDLGSGTRKYLDRDLEVRDARCYYADVGDYRCVQTEGGTVIFTPIVTPDAAKKYLEDHCDTLKKALLSAPCRVDMRFRYSADQTTEDFVSGMEKRTVIKPAEVSLVPQR